MPTIDTKDVDKKQLSSNVGFNHPQRQKCKQSPYIRKTRTTGFWDNKDILLVDFHVPTINAKTYCKTLQKLRCYSKQTTWNGV